MIRDLHRDLQELLNLVWSEKGGGAPAPMLRVRRKAGGLPSGRYTPLHHAIAVSVVHPPDWRCRWVLLHEAAHALLGPGERGHTLAFWRVAFSLYLEYGDGFDMQEVVRSECAYRSKAADGARQVGLEVHPDWERGSLPTRRRARRKVLYLVPGLDYSQWQGLVGRFGKPRSFESEAAAREEVRGYAKHRSFEFAVIPEGAGQYKVHCRQLKK